MKKFSRTLKHSLKKLSRLILLDEKLELKKWLIYLCSENFKIYKVRKQIEYEKLKFGTTKIKDLEKELAKRGEVFHVNFGYGIGSEYRYDHYCVVLKTEGKVAIVVPLTSQNSTYNRNSNLVLNLGIINKMPGKAKDSYALINQIRTVSRARLKRPSVGRNKFYPKLNSNQLNIIDQGMQNLLGP